MVSKSGKADDPYLIEQIERRRVTLLDGEH